jgi:hypothetical protein
MRHIRVLVQTTLLVFLSSSAYAFSGWTGDDWALHGRLKQGSSVLYDLPEDGATVGPTNTTAEIKFSYRPSRNWTFIANAWWRADWSPDIGGDFDSGLGLQDPTSAGFNGRTSFLLHTNDCARTLADPFCASSKQIRRFDDLDEVLREFSLKYRDSKNRFTVKAGKFQRGWGQSDGLRLLDVLHPQDLRERFAFRDSDELRIPAWMVSMDFNFRKLGIAKPFEKLGMKRPVLEFNFTPEVNHSWFEVNNPTPTNPTSGGIFGLPFPVLRDPVSGFGLVGIGANLGDRDRSGLSFKDAEYSLRLKFDTLGGQATLNAFYGQQDLPIVTMTGSRLVVGNPLNNEPNATAVIPLDLATTIGAIHAPSTPTPGGTVGGYLPWLRSVAAGAPIAFPLSAGGLAPLSALSGGAFGDCIDPVFGPGSARDVPCSINVNFDLDYRFRQKLVGFSFARDLGEFKFGPKQTSPALRLEVMHEFGKPFNRSVAADPFIPGAKVTGSNALVVAPSSAVTYSNVLSTMIGFDYPLWVPGWDTQQKSVFTSFQFFNVHTFEADKGLLQQAPYGFDTVPDDNQFVTFLWNMPIMNERLVFEGLFIQDFYNDGSFYRQRVDFQFFGNNWRPRLEWMSFYGKGENAPIGILDRSDFVELSITYQF